MTVRLESVPNQHTDFSARHRRSKLVDPSSETHITLEGPVKEEERIVIRTEAKSIRGSDGAKVVEEP